MPLFRIRPEKLDMFLAWGQSLQENPEAFETLKEERVNFEAFYYFQVNGDYFAIGVTDNPNPLPATDRALNIRHKEILKECLEPVGKLMSVYQIRTGSDM